MATRIRQSQGFYKKLDSFSSLDIPELQPPGKKRCSDEPSKLFPVDRIVCSRIKHRPKVQWPHREIIPKACYSQVLSRSCGENRFLHGYEMRSGREIDSVLSVLAVLLMCDVTLSSFLNTLPAESGVSCVMGNFSS